MKITVIGCGRWGSLITWYLSSRKGHDVTLYGLASAPQMQRFLKERKNDLLTLPDTVKLSTDITSVVDPACETVIISVGAQDFRGLMEELAPYHMKDKTVVLCMKGIEATTGKRLTEVATEYLDPSMNTSDIVSYELDFITYIDGAFENKVYGDVWMKNIVLKDAKYPLKQIKVQNF